MMKKVRGLGKGFIMLSALLLMFAAVGCDDSDSTGDLTRFDVRVVEGGETTRVADLVAGTYSTADAAATSEGTPVETVVTFTVPAGINAYTNAGMSDRLTGDVRIVVKAYDPNSFRFFPDNEQSDWVTAGYFHIYVLDDDGERRSRVFFDQNIDVTVDISDNMVGQMITAGTLLPVYMKESDEPWNFIGDEPLSATKTVTFTISEGGFALIGEESETNYLSFDEFVTDNCDAIIEFNDDGNNIDEIIRNAVSVFGDRVNLGYVGAFAEGQEVTLYLSFGGVDFVFPLTFFIEEAECLTGI